MFEEWVSEQAMNLINESVFRYLAVPGETNPKQMALAVAMWVSLAAMLFIVGAVGQANGRAKGFVKYLSVPILLGGMAWGIPYYQYATDSFNVSAALIGGNATPAYKAAPIICGVLAVVAVIAGIILDKQVKRNAII